MRPENNQLAGWQNGKRGILLLVFKQPGANVIDTVERIKAALPRLEASIPPSIHTSIVMDRTQTIRASVADVQFTLVLSIALVVMVIFVFLRNVWATIIPSLTVPVALVCTFAVMYLLGLQPGQSVADGADDLGRLRRGRRDRHAGEHLPPYRRGHEAAGRGAEGRRRDRLHHRLHQLLPDRGVHPAAADGRHRRAAVPRVRDDRDRCGGGLGDRVADADADDVLALPVARPCPARPDLPRHRGCLRRAAELLPPHAGCCAAPSVPDADGLLRHDGPDGLSVHHHSEGLLSHPGYRRGHRHLRGRAGCLIRRDDAAAAEPGRRDRRRSRCRFLRIDRRCRRRRADRQ